MTDSHRSKARWPRIVWPAAIVIGAIVLVVLMMGIRPAPEQAAVENPPMLVDVIAVEKSTVDFEVRSQGTVVPRTETTMMAEVGGQVVWVSPQFVAGGFFKAGDVLLQIDPSDYQVALMRAEAALAGRQAQLAKEQAQAAQARKDWNALQRQEQPSPLLLREPQMAEAHANVQAAQADVEKAKRDLERSKVRAPYAGVVQSKLVDMGQYVAPGVQLGVTFAIDRAEIRLPLGSDDLAYLDLPLLMVEQAPEPLPEVRLSARIAGQEHHWQAQIVRTEGTFDQRTRVIHAVAQVVDPYGVLGGADKAPLPMGTFVEARIAGVQANDIIALPRHVLSHQNTVLVAGQDDLLQLRQVSVLRADAEYVYIASGLDNGSRVITTAVDLAVPGTPLQVNRPDAAGLAEQTKVPPAQPRLATQARGR